MSVKRLVLPVLSVFLVVGVILTGSCASRETKAPSQIIETITSQEAFSLIKENQKNPEFVILDVRTQPEFAEGYIENAINIDYYSNTFRDELNKLDKNNTYLIYCRSGSRSGKALDIMGGLNFKEVYNVSGGIIAWNAEGMPTVK